MDTDAKEIADKWKAKYGEEITNNSLWPAASPANAHKFELQVEASRFALKRIPLLKRQEKERAQHLKDHLPNRSKSLAEYMKDVEDDYKPDPVVSLHSDLKRHFLTQTPSLYQALEKEAARLPKWAEEHPDYRGYAFGRACYQVSEWIRAHKKDGKTSWPDVVTCLRWHGWDLPHGGDHETKARMASGRWKSRTLLR